MNTSQFNVYYIDTENRPHVEQILPDVKKEKKEKKSISGFFDFSLIAMMKVQKLGY